jgi:CheY-like chemotaxis protein
MTQISRKPQGTPPVIPINWVRMPKTLLVEDNEVNQEVIIELLAEIGLYCDVAIHGLDALEKMRNCSTGSPYDLLFMDCQMPKMDGYTATREIRNGSAGPNHTNVPILAITAHALKTDRQRCLDTGMTDYLSKPIEKHQLFEKINLLLAEFIQPVDAATTSLNISASKGEQSEIIFPDNLLAVKADRNRPLGIKSKSTFVKILGIYATKYTTFEKELILAQENSNTEKLKILIHTLCGSSGSVGFLPLHDHCLELEQQLDTVPMLSSEQVIHLTTLLRNSLSDCQSLLSANSFESTSTSTKKIAKTFTIELLSFLDRGEVIPSTLLTELESAISIEKMDNRFERIANLIKTFDYPEASVIVKDMIDEE